MKRLVLIPLLLLVFSVSAQTDTALGRRLDAYMAATGKGDISAILDLVYPKVFHLIPRTTLEEETRKIFDSPEVSTRLDSCSVDSVHPTFLVGNGIYAVVDYSFTMRLKSKEKSDKMQEIAAMMETIMKTPVTYDSTSDVFVIPAKADMLAIRNEASPNWTFIDYKKLKSFSTMLLDAEVWAKLED